MKKSFWDLVSGVYDLFERIYNRRCYDSTGLRWPRRSARATGSWSAPAAPEP